MVKGEKMLMTQTKSYRYWLKIAVFAHFSIIFILGLCRHWGYMSSINDLGIYDQAVWGVLHGQSLLNTSQLNQPINWLGFHFHPIILLFVPLYALVPNVIWFTTAQAFALSIGAWPIFLLVKHVCQSERVGLFWAIAYLVNPFLLNAAAWDFHPITLSVPLIATAMLAIEKKIFGLLVFSSLFILACKEHLGIMVIGFGLVWWIYNKNWKIVLIVIFLGAAHFFLVLKFFMPIFSPVNTHIMFEEGLGRLSLYAWLGNSLGEILYTLLLHPMYVAKTVLVKMNGASYLLGLLIPFLLFPLAAPVFLLPGLADIMANMMSANPLPRSLFAYHSISLIPVLTVAAVYGSKRISSWSKSFSENELAGFVIITSFILGYYFAPLPLPGARNDWAPARFINLPDKTVNNIRSLIGYKASVSAQSNVGAHFSQRQEIYRYPNKIGEVDVIVLRLKSPTNNINNLSQDSIKDRKNLVGMLDSHLQMDRVDYIASIESLLSKKEYGVILWDDPWLVLSKNSSNQKPYTQIEQKLHQLKKEWKVN